eukprot:gnl/TRDRNA2_/TRDRNA2_40535_c0_seq1.p1 gnl/TRDRNA2_/TRDRNA2_40535_c0~~gnl/TRDRNA2_/TRDRNA2_40535_c0_seq1.p1  ORF type:complete len:222 (-),score=27.16 gnl/TRDRNA2_/TRDRNA2_40535_c0_seq1:191-793(-)
MAEQEKRKSHRHRHRSSSHSGSSKPKQQEGPMESIGRRTQELVASTDRAATAGSGSNGNGPSAPYSQVFHKEGKFEIPGTPSKVLAKSMSSPVTGVDALPSIVRSDGARERQEATIPPAPGPERSEYRMLSTALNGSLIPYYCEYPDVCTSRQDYVWHDKFKKGASLRMFMKPRDPWCDYNEKFFTVGNQLIMRKSRKLS